MVIDCSNHNFMIPTRAVLTGGDITKWEKSEAYQDIMGFLTSMNHAVRGKKLSTPCDDSPVITNLLEMLDTISIWIDEIPPVDQPQRFGNKAFRDFYARLKENGEAVLKKALPEEYDKAVPEISVYLVESFGNSTRIDYGTGHELAFVMFLASIFKIGALVQKDSLATVNKIFKRYLDLARKLQMTYKMEPAGSQGVWSLDDFQFIPFIWGSSQLHMHPKIAPEMFCNENIVNENADEYMFLGCIRFILSVKTGPFAEHSNQLWNISAVQSWGKINQGLFKMYKAEILAKFPVIQHVLFGTILSISPAAEIKYQASGSELPGMRRPLGTFSGTGSLKMAVGKLPSGGRFSLPGPMVVEEGRLQAPGHMPSRGNRSPSSPTSSGEGKFQPPSIPRVGRFPQNAGIASQGESSSVLANKDLDIFASTKSVLSKDKMSAVPQDSSVPSTTESSKT